MRAVRLRAAESPVPNSSPTASAIGNIMAAVAVLEIHIEMNPVASITPRITPRALPAARVTMAYAIRA